MVTLARDNSTEVINMTKKVETMTKKEMTERVVELEEQALQWQAEREQIFEQANLMQKEHGKRLTFLRILEGFANTVDAGLAQVKRDIQELNATFAEEAKQEEEV